MSVATRNPFALLEDDVSSRPSTPAPASAKAAPAPATTAAPTRGTQKTRGGPASRGGRYYPRGGKSSAPKENQNGEVAAEDGAEPRKRFDGEGRGRGRGGRGRGGDRGRGGRRTFDKHSATGKTDSEKKVHQGWGGDEGNAELKAEAAAETDAQAEAAPAGDGWGEPVVADVWATPAEGAEVAAPAEGEKAESRPRREEEEEDNTLTLDEYIKNQKKELDIIPKLEARKANEGDDSIWKDAVVVSKKTDEEDAYFVGKNKANAPKTKAQKPEKVFLEIDARFERPQRGGRGGRGGDRPPRGGRGRGGRGRGANGNNSSPALNVDDQTAFPSLS